MNYSTLLTYLCHPLVSDCIKDLGKTGARARARGRARLKMYFSLISVLLVVGMTMLGTGMPIPKSSQGENMSSMNLGNVERLSVSAVKCEKTNPLRYNPKELFDPTGFGNSQISIERTSGIAYIQAQTCVQSDGSIPVKTQEEQLDYAALNVKTAVESLETRLDSVLTLTVRIVKFDPMLHLKAVMALGKAFKSPALSVIGVESLNFPDLLVSIEATVLVNKTFIRELKNRMCIDSTLLPMEDKKVDTSSEHDYENEEEDKED